MAETAVQAAVAEEPSNGTEATPGVRCKMKDLNLGGLVVVEGLRWSENGAGRDQGPDRSGQRQAGGSTGGRRRFHVESARFNPDEEVSVVGKNVVRANRSKSGKKAPGKGKGETKPKAEQAEGKGAKLEPEKGKPEHDKATKVKARKATGEKKMSALDAAAKVLGESGLAMNCQEMIKAMSEKGYWQSPGGLTPHATLYSAILRELKAKGGEARFRKTERGKFSATTACGPRLLA
jgi:hypothetical protein